MHPVANGLHPRPARVEVAKKFVGDVGKAVNFAVAAVEQVAEEFAGHFADGNFASTDTYFVGQAGVLDERGIVQAQETLRGDEARAAIAEGVDVLGCFDLGLDVQGVRLDKVFIARGMNVQQRHHGKGIRKMELYVVA